MAVLDHATLENWFGYHSPTPEQLEAYAAIRIAAMILAEIIVKHTVPCADQSSAIRHVRVAVMEATASIACGGV